MNGRVIGRLLLGALVLGGLGSAAGGACAQEYRAVLRENGRALAVGVVRLDAAKRVTVVSARPGRARLLHQMADEVNAEDVLQVEAAAAAGSPRFANVGAPVRRHDPRFRAVLLAHVQRYYDLTFSPVR